MDALDIMANLEAVFPYYQPIISADALHVIGYEVFGRMKTEEGVVSLGEFFHDDSVPEEFRQEVDRVVLTKALHYFAAQDEPYLLFINQDANLLMEDRGASLLELLEAERGTIPLQRIVIEVEEHAYRGDIQALNHLFMYLRTYGLQVAVANVGHQGSSIDRVSLLTPDILKIDMLALRSNTLSTYGDVLYSIVLLARKIGATLLYEDIEASYQLQYAWRNGGRYYQGFYISEPSETLVPRDFLLEQLKRQFHTFITHEQRKLEAIYELSEQFTVRIEHLLTKHKKYDSYTQLIHQLALELSDCSFRVYICDADGFQRSANIIKKAGEWLVEEEKEMKNWSWRPYFLENIMRMKHNKSSTISDVYSDIETGELTRTFSYPINDDHYLYVDFSYEFLYDKEGLL